MVLNPLHSFLTILADLVDLDDLATPAVAPVEADIKSKGRRQSKSNASTNLPKLKMPLASKSIDSPASAVSSTDGLMTPTEGMSARQLNVLKRKAKANKSAANKCIPNYIASNRFQSTSNRLFTEHCRAKNIHRCSKRFHYPSLYQTRPRYSLARRLLLGHRSATRCQSGSD